MEINAPDFRVVEASYDEMDELLDLSEAFFKESNYHGHTTFNRQKLRGNLFQAWQNRPRDFITFVAVTAYGRMAGFAHVRREDVFTNEDIGELYQFYVLPEYRGTAVGRRLRDAVDQQFQDWKCAFSYVECGAGLDARKNDMLFFNSWRKIGFEFLGTVLFKRG